MSFQRLPSEPKCCELFISGTKFQLASSANVVVGRLDVNPSIPRPDRSTVLPPEIVKSASTSARVCGMPSPPPPPLPSPPVGAAATHVVPLYVSTSPISPSNVRLSDKTAVP